jgi:precorrin-3B synthase
MPARTVAPAIAAAAAPLLDGSLTLHLSGCQKGCAHRGAAALTIVGQQGGYGLVHDDDARATPHVTVSERMLPARLARLSDAVAAARAPRERASETLARLGKRRIAAILAEQTDG